MNEEAIRILRERAIDGIVQAAADENIGIYPASINGEKRTEWQDGWNACVLQRQEIESKAEKWLKAIEPPEARALVEDALIRDTICMNVREDSISLYVLCNDLFWWACSDLEDIEPSEIPALNAHVETFGEAWGSDRWCAIKRQMRPQWPAVKLMVAAGAWDQAMDALPLRDDDGDHGWKSSEAQAFLKEREAAAHA